MCNITDLDFDCLELIYNKINSKYKTPGADGRYRFYFALAVNNKQLLEKSYDELRARHAKLLTKYLVPKTKDQWYNDCAPFIGFAAEDDDTRAKKRLRIYQQRWELISVLLKRK